MRRKKKKAAVGVIFLYLILTAGSYMFINSYANSYNHMTDEKIAPASLITSGSTARVEILEYRTQLDLSGLSPDSKLYCAAYLLAPDELRTAAYLISALL